MIMNNLTKAATQSRLVSILHKHPYIWNLIVVALTCVVFIGLTLALKWFGVDKENLLMLFFIGVLLGAILTPGYVYGAIISVVFFFSFNFLFTEPRHSFAVDNQRDVFMLLFFLATSFIGSFISSRLQSQAEIARRNEKRTEELYRERSEIELAIESEKMKSLLLRSISHDLRTPLTGISGASGAILENYDTLDDESIKALIHDIQEEAQGLGDTVQNILDMTRISEGKLSLDTEYEAVDDLVAQTAAKVPFLTRDNRLTIHLPEQIIMVEVDGRLLVQALFNLIDNAYKHSGENTRVSLRIFTEGEWLAFEVSDNGAGIDETIMSKLFVGFVTSPHGISDKGRGVGLGLSICKAIATAHGGSITAENIPGSGACFTIRIPYCEDVQI